MKDGFETNHVRYVAALALSRDEELPQDVVADYLLLARMDLVALSRRLRPDWIDGFEDSWASVLEDPARPVAQRLRAGLMLAGGKSTATSDDDTQLASGLEDHIAFLAGAIIEESLSNKFAYADLIELSRPMRKALQPELISTVWDPSQNARKDAALTLIRDLNEGHPTDLIDAALDLPRSEFLEIVQATDLNQIPAKQIEQYLSSADSDSRQPGGRVGRAIAIGAVKATSERTRSTTDDFDWPTTMTDMTQRDREDLGDSSLIHSLVPLGFDPERLFDTVFDNNAGLRCVQLYALGEVLQSNKIVNEGFKNRCRSVARERFHSDPDPGVFSAARWLLIRLGDQIWLEEELASRIERVVVAEGNEGSSRRVRINAQKTPMIRFAAGTIAATTDPDQSIPDLNWNDPLPYEIEVATDEVTVKKFKEGDPAYFHAGELKSQDEHIPVGVVPWEEAVAHCNWLTLHDGMSESDFAYETDAKGNSTLRRDFANRRGYRLPTAREWVAIWDADPARVACVMDDSLVEFYARIQPFAGGIPEPVGGVKPDRNGLFHLAGNAHEWCSDHLPTGHRAIRGSFYEWGLAERNRITIEAWIPKEIAWVRYGFRVVRSTARESSPD